MLTTIFSSFGAAIGLSRLNSFISAGRTSFRYFSRMRAVDLLFALGRAGFPEASSAAASTCSGFAFLPCGFPSAPGFGLFCFFSFSSAISCFTFLTVSDVAPFREVLNFDS